MISNNYLKTVCLLIYLASLIFACQSPTPPNIELEPSYNATADTKHFTERLEKHLKAVSDQDLATLKSTLSPEGDMILILPQSPMRTKVEEFMSFHEEWFQDTTWSFEPKILHTDVHPEMGIAIVESLYSEPERNGKPYYNKMLISYALRKMDGEWYIVKDHACSIEKSTDIN